MILRRQRSDAAPASLGRAIWRTWSGRPARQSERAGPTLGLGANRVVSSSAHSTSLSRLEQNEIPKTLSSIGSGRCENLAMPIVQNNGRSTGRITGCDFMPGRSGNPGGPPKRLAGATCELASHGVRVPAHMRVHDGPSSANITTRTGGTLTAALRVAAALLRGRRTCRRP
jgi:hypothetical protein